VILLLDINILLALADPDHVHAEAALQFFENKALREGWATCPLVENGFLRIFGHSEYPDGPGSPDLARQVLRSITANPGHQFWPDDVTMRDGALFPALPGSKRLTDAYLLALAVKRGGRFATFDREVDSSQVRRGAGALLLIPAG
jgi:toxin-antitoxin system PIN domain toxin